MLAVWLWRPTTRLFSSEHMLRWQLATWSVHLSSCLSWASVLRQCEGGHSVLLRALLICGDVSISRASAGAVTFAGASSCALLASCARFSWVPHFWRACSSSLRWWSFTIRGECHRFFACGGMRQPLRVRVQCTFIYCCSGCRRLARAASLCPGVLWTSWGLCWGLEAFALQPTTSPMPLSLH